MYQWWIKVAFIVSQPGQQFHRMDFPLEVKLEQRTRYYLPKAVFWIMFVLHWIFRYLRYQALHCTGSCRPGSLRHPLSQTVPLLNLWSGSRWPGTTWNHLEPPGTFWDPLVPHGATLNYIGPPGTSWDHPGTTWNYLEPPGHPICITAPFFESVIWRHHVNATQYKT